MAALPVVYFVWGSTYLAIRVALTASPPFLLAGLRAATAVALLLGGEHVSPLGATGVAVSGLGLVVLTTAARPRG